MGKPLTVRDLLHAIQELRQNQEITLDTPIVYSSDDEGNSYQACICLPGQMMMNRKVKEYGERFDYDVVFDEKHDEERFISLCLN